MLLPLHDQSQRPNLPAVLFPRDAEVGGRRALADAVQDTGAKPAPALVGFLDVEGAGAELEDPLQHLHGQAQALRAGERPVELDPPPPWRARELDARKVFADANLQVRER